MLDDKDEQGAALPNPQLASRNQSNRTTPFLKRKQPSSSCSSSDDSSDSGDDTSSSDSSMGLSKHSSGAKKRRATSSPRTTTTSNKGQSKPSAASDQTKPLKPGAVRGSDPLDAQYVWQMMIQQQRHDADGIHSSKPPVEAASTQSSSNMRSQVDAQRVVSTLTPNTSTNTPGNKKKNKMKQRKEAEGTPAASTNARPKEPFALVVAEKKRVGVPSYVPIVSASQLVAGDSIRYRQPVLEKAVPGLSDELEVRLRVICLCIGFTDWSLTFTVPLCVTG
ncbi:hypothetical protein EON65_10050 [archaeon]|nr:MAG: hypothetical protein EON65_10050 [archaeon]